MTVRELLEIIERLDELEKIRVSRSVGLYENEEIEKDRLFDTEIIPEHWETLLSKIILRNNSKI